MNANKLILLTVFAVGAFAAPSALKTKLGQMNAKTLAEVQVDTTGIITGPPVCTPPILSLPQCPCNFSTLPGLGNGVSQGFEQRAEVSQVATLSAVPDTAFTQICQSNCCECAESVHAALASSSKNRTFYINGAITVTETVSFAEEEVAAENSQSREEKNTVCVTNNLNGGLGATPECVNVTTCTVAPGVGLGTSVKKAY